MAHGSQSPLEGLSAHEAEQCLLGIILSDSDALGAVREVCRPDHFVEPFHQRLFETILRLNTEGRATAPEVLFPIFSADPSFQAMGGPVYFMDLVDKAPPWRLAPDFAQTIVEQSSRRQLVTLAQEVISAAGDQATKVEAILSEMEKGAAAIGRASFTRDHWIDAGDLVANAIVSAENRGGRIDFPFGLTELDDMTSGAHAGELTLIGGRPGMAKTTAVGRIALANARAGRGTLVFSLEMADEPMGLRIGCDVAYEVQTKEYSAYPEGNPNPTVSGAMRNKLTAPQRSRLREAAETVRSLPLRLDTRSALTLSQIESSARRAQRRWEKMGVAPGPIIVDHLGKVRPEKERNGSKHAEIADISSGLAELAKRMGVPVIACAQLNRGVEGRGEDKRPVLSDLRQAGELEEDARQVIFLYRPEYYYRPPENASDETPEARNTRTTKLKAVKNKLFFLVEKNSHGPTGQVEAFCDIACSVVRDRQS